MRGEGLSTQDEGRDWTVGFRGAQASVDDEDFKLKNTFHAISTTGTIVITQ